MLFLEAVVNGYHGNFDDVRRTALYRGIDSVAFGITAHHCVVAVDVAQIAFTMVNGFGISLFTRCFNALLHVFLHFGIRGEIAVNQLFGFRAADVHSFGQSEYGDTVYDAEIGCFGLASFFAGNFFQWLFVNFCGGSGMDVVPFAESLYHVWVAAQVGHDTQFDLGIVGREEFTTRFRDKSLADFFAFLVAYRDVLQVRVTAAQSSGRGNGLIEGGVDMSGFGIDKLGQGIDVCAQ